LRRPYLCLMFNVNYPCQWAPQSDLPKIPEQAYLPLLTLLANSHIKSHWFVTGTTVEMLESSPLAHGFRDALHSYVQAGLGWVENYTYSHPILSFFPDDAVSQLRLGEWAINNSFGQGVGVGFLPPEYVLCADIFPGLAELGKKWIAVRDAQLPVGTPPLVRHSGSQLLLVGCSAPLKVAVERAMAVLDFSLVDNLIQGKDVVLSLDAETWFFNTCRGQEALGEWLKGVNGTHDIINVPEAANRVGDVPVTESFDLLPGTLAPWEAGESYLSGYRAMLRPIRTLDMKYWLRAQNSDGLLLPGHSRDLVTPRGVYRLRFDPFLHNLESLNLLAQRGSR